MDTRRVIASLALAAAVSGASATGAEASYSGGFNAGTNTVVLVGDSESDRLRLFRDGAGQVFIDIGDNGSPDDITGDGVVDSYSIASTSGFFISAGGGNDTLTVDEAMGAIPAVRVNGGAGDDVVTTGSAADEITGDDGNDTLLGKGGADSIVGGDGNDVITPGDADDDSRGGAGDDTIIWNPGDDTDTVDGGAGSDTSEINGGNGAEMFSVTKIATGVRLERTNPAPFSITGLGIERGTVNGNGGDDSVTAGIGLAGVLALTIDPGAGSDTIVGSDGDDVVTTAAAWIGPAETIDGRLGSDTFAVRGTDGPDAFAITPDGSAFRFSSGTPPGVPVTAVEKVAIDVQGGDDTVAAEEAVGDRASIDAELGAGNDRVSGTSAGDRLAGGEGDDELRAFGGADQLSGGPGTDILDGGAGVDSISCGVFGDTIVPDAQDVLADDCRAPEPPQPPAAAPPGGGAPVLPAGGGGPSALPRGFLGFARPTFKATSSALSVTITNTHTAPITVAVAATESRTRFKSVRRTIAPGKRVTVKLATPKKVRSALKRAIARRGRAVRRPSVTVSNPATGGKLVLKPKITVRR